MTDTIIEEINEILSRLPKAQLESILAYLKALDEADKDDVESASIINKIFREDEKLLNRLSKIETIIEKDFEKYDDVFKALAASNTEHKK